MGISVKSRSRNTGTEGTNVSITADNFEKAGAACEAFGCVSYFAVVVDAANSIACFLTSMDHLLEIHPVGKSTSSWAMSKPWLARYRDGRLGHALRVHESDHALVGVTHLTSGHNGRRIPDRRRMGRYRGRVSRRSCYRREPYLRVALLKWMAPFGFS